MTTSPWAAPTGDATPPPGAPAQPPGAVALGAPPSAPPTLSGPPPRRGRWVLVTGVAAVVLVLMAGTAAVTYALTRNGQTTATTTPAPSSPSAQPPQYSAADQQSAKDNLCRIFDISVRGEKGQGGLRINGQTNLPVVLRTVNSAVAVQNALTPAAPPEVAAAARKYVNSTLELTTAAMGSPSVDEVNRLTAESNDAEYALADVCGLPH